MKKFSIALILVMISSVITFTSVELILRIFYKFPQPQFMTVDSIIGHKHRPNTEGYFTREGLGFVQINKHGLRDKDYNFERNSKKRIAILGDSFTEAFHVNLEHTFHSLLEAEFEDSLEVLNFGVGGYSTAQELLTYKNLARKFKPDVVVLAFFPGNDFKDNHKKLSNGFSRPYYSINQGELKIDNSFQNSSKQKRSSSFYAIYYFLTDHSIIFTFLDKLRYRVKKGDILNMESDLIYSAPVTKDHIEAWSVTEQLILTLANEVEKDGTKFMLFVLDSMPGQLKTSGNKFYTEERLGKLCQDNSLLCSFMAPEAFAHYESTGKSLHGFNASNSGHWNKEGHRVAHTILRNELIQNELLP